MNTPEVVQFVDELFFAKTGKHLNDLQRAIIEGTLNRQKYSHIAETYGCTVGHAKDVGYKILQILSDIFEESVNQKNLKSVLERQINLNINLGNNYTFQNYNKISYINNCPTPSPSTPDKSQPVSPNRPKKKKPGQMKLISKLRQFGLSDEQIAEVLNLPLDVVKSANLEH